MFPKVVTTYTRYERSDSPEFNINKAQTLPYSLRYHSNKQDKAFLNADNLKMQMMEERIKQLERQKYDQNEQINALMSHQMNQNRLHKSNSTNIMPLNQQPNPLLLAGNNILQPFDSRKKYYGSSKTDHDFHKKQKKLQKSYKKGIDAIKDLLEGDKIDKKINRNLKNNVYLPIKNDISNYMEEINYNIQRKMENDNNIIHNNLNEVQNNYDEMKYLLKDKIDKIELKQKMDFENLKSQLHNSSMNNENDEIIINKKQSLQSEINDHIKEEIRKQREIDEMNHQKELDELRRKHEMEDFENKKIADELRFQRMKNGLLKTRNHRQSTPTPPPVVQPMIQQMPLPLFYPLPNNQGNGNNGHTSDELFKLFMMKSLFGEDLFPSQKKKEVKYKFLYDNNRPLNNHNHHHHHHMNHMNCPYCCGGNNMIRNNCFFQNPNYNNINSMSLTNFSNSELSSKHHGKHHHHHKHKSTKKSSEESESNSKSESKSTKSKKDKEKKKSKKSSEKSKKSTTKESKKDKKEDKKKDKKKKKDEEEEEEEGEENEGEEENEEEEEEDDKKKKKGKKKKKKGDDEEEEENEEGEGEENEDNEGGEEDDEEGNEENEEGEGDNEEEGENEEGEGEGDNEEEGEGDEEE